MQKATFAITISHHSSRLYEHSLQKAKHTTFIITLSRFKIHETLLTKQPNFLNFKNYPYEKGKP